MAEGIVGTWEVEERDLDPMEVGVELRRYKAHGWTPMEYEHCGATSPELTPQGTYRLRLTRPM